MTNTTDGKVLLKRALPYVIDPDYGGQKAAANVAERARVFIGGHASDPAAKLLRRAIPYVVDPDHGNYEGAGQIARLIGTHIRRRNLRPQSPDRAASAGVGRGRVLRLALTLRPRVTRQSALAAFRRYAEMSEGKGRPWRIAKRRRDGLLLTHSSRRAGGVDFDISFGPASDELAVDVHGRDAWLAVGYMITMLVGPLAGEAASLHMDIPSGHPRSAAEDDAEPPRRPTLSRSPLG